MPQFQIEIAGSAFVVDYWTRVTSRPFAGRGPDFNSPGEPPEAGEFEVEVQAIHPDLGRGQVGEMLQFPIWLQNTIARHIEGDDGVYREVFDGRNDGPDPDTAYDAMRDDKERGFKDDVF